ncbi:hypothetical protein EMCG_02670 [[Emmonsia] crescens]|uniref:DUF7918 domain-containing protein n=1 Tax=[Emmonsia] crescens TaxID=73230 RepID=A0A0G2HYS3_9EURO|nr:hypothetical protein EMCG_02670 [Emmonsia crescens UAMH 3008]
MPTLKQLSCQIEWAGSSVPFKEYGTAYGDGYVESYIAIPNSSTPFSINLRSNGYIAPGLAMFVLMDGVYQCNRNRNDLRPLVRPSDATRKFRDIGFRVRQREEKLPDGSWVGRPWRFERFQLVKSSGDNPDIVKHFERLGTIQIVVLRCAAHPRAKCTRDDDILDGAHTPESGMAPGSEGEDDESISSDESLIYEYHNGRFYEGNGEIWGALGGLFDGPYDSGCYVQGPPHHQPYPHCCPSCHHPHDHYNPRPFGFTPGHNGGGYQHSWHVQQQPVVEPHCHVDHTCRETMIDAPDIPHCRRTHSRTQNPRYYSGCHNPQPNLPLNNHENTSHPLFPRSGHIHKITSSNRENLTSGISHGEPQGDSRFFVPPIVLNINPQQFKDSSSHNDRSENCLKSNDNGYYVISDGKRVSESSSCGRYENNSGDASSGADNHGKKKSRRSRRRSRGKDEHEQHQADSNQQGEDSSWENNGNQQQDRCGVDGEATSSPWTESNQAVDTNNDNSQPGNWNASDDNNQSSSWNQNTDPSPNVQPFTASPNRPQEPPMRQIRDFSQSCSSYQPVFVSPMFSEPARDEPPLYTVPESVARAESLTHQVQLGPQAKYIHRIRTPEYLDTMDKPYAEFIFKYRTADVIQNKFQVTVASDIDEERRKLESLPRIEIVNQLLRAQGLLSNSDMNNNNRSPRTSPPAPFAQPQSPDQRMPHWNSSPTMNSNPQNLSNGDQPGSIARSPPCRPPRGQWQQNGSSGGNVNTLSNNGLPASIDSKLGQVSQNSNGGNGEQSQANQNNDSSFHGTNDNNNNNNNNNNSWPSWDTPTTNETNGGGNGGTENGLGGWESEATNGRGVDW